MDREAMDRDPFVVRANISRYRELLRTETDDLRREMLRRLIAEFEAKLPPTTEERGC